VRHCVYRADDAQSGAALPSPVRPRALDREDVLRRLDVERLRERPTDAAELGHAITRRAERLRADGHPQEAFAALAEVRYVFEPLLGIERRASAPPTEDLFGAEIAQMAAQQMAQRSWRARGFRSRENEGRAFNPKAWALNVLGKSYRLCAELALDLARADARWYGERADKYQHYVSNLDPLLPYPYAHRLHLLREHRIGSEHRATLLRHLREDLSRLKAQTECGPLGRVRKPAYA
jgi:hypothetical protein